MTDWDWKTNDEEFAKRVEKNVHAYIFGDENESHAAMDDLQRDFKILVCSLVGNIHTRMIHEIKERNNMIIYEGQSHYDFLFSKAERRFWSVMVEQRMEQKYSSSGLETFLETCLLEDFGVTLHTPPKIKHKPVFQEDIFVHHPGSSSGVRVGTDIGIRDHYSIYFRVVDKDKLFRALMESEVNEE